MDGAVDDRVPRRRLIGRDLLQRRQVEMRPVLVDEALPEVGDLGIGLSGDMATGSSSNP